MSEPKGRVLLVDDEVAILRAYGRVLREQGWMVEPISDAREAVAHVSKPTSYDVIISDVTMPHMGGLAFLRAVRELDDGLTGHRVGDRGH